MSINDGKTIPAVVNTPNQYVNHQQTKKRQPVVDVLVDQPTSTRVLLSKKATRLLSSSQPVDQEKVEKAKQALKSGGLAIDTNKIASALAKHLFQ